MIMMGRIAIIAMRPFTFDSAESSCKINKKR